MQRFVSVALASALAVSGCATTHLGGEYRTDSVDLVHKAKDQKTLAKGSEWQFFWGLLDTGRFNVDKELRHQLRENEVITDIDVKDHLSLGGFVLFLITGGLVSHHTIVVEGKPAVVRSDKDRTSMPPAATRERETIVVPAQPAPAGVGRTDRSADYRSGYEEGRRDAGARAPRRSFPDRSGDYRSGYEDGLRDAIHTRPIDEDRRD